jgi:hypothetical protein
VKFIFIIKILIIENYSVILYIMKIRSLAILLIFSCFSYSQNKSNKEQAETYFLVRNAEYGYDYVLPNSVSKELVEINDKREVSIYYSSDKTYTIRIFSENTFEVNEKTEKLKEYYQNVLSGNHPDVKNVTILEKKLETKKGTFYIRGKIKGKEFIWKTYVSEIPVSGEFICNSMLFLYSKSKNHSLGKELSNMFGK